MFFVVPIAAVVVSRFRLDDVPLTDHPPVENCFESTLDANLNADVRHGVSTWRSGLSQNCEILFKNGWGEDGKGNQKVRQKHSERLKKIRFTSRGKYRVEVAC